MSDLFIDSLNIRLPRGFEHRADAIARETSRQLSKLPLLEHSIQLDGINIPRLQVSGGETNGVIARRIAGSIHNQITALAAAGGVAKGEGHD